MKLLAKLAMAAAVAGLAFTVAPTESMARGAKKMSYCAPGSVRVTKSTCGKWGCHYQRCWWTGAQTAWLPSLAYCVQPWCPKYR
jgi:hypothetical protein